MKTVSPLFSWLQLFRLPNLLTVPGDPLMGFIVVAGGLHGGGRPLAAILIASLLFYMSGLLLNDISDLETDRAERPARPLPSGRVGVKTAGVVALILKVLGLAACFLAGRDAVIVGALLILAIHLYNHIAKQRPVVGPLAMGLCRGLSVGLGAAAAAPLTLSGSAWPLAAGFMTAYIACVTVVARQEVAETKPGFIAWLPAIASLAGFAILYRVVSPGTAQAWCGFGGAWGLALLVAVLGAYRLNRSAKDGPLVIGTWIGALLLYQASLCMAFGSIAAGLALLIFWPVFRYLGRWFYAS